MCHISFAWDFPVDAGRKLNVHKTFRRRPERLLNVLCTFNLRPVSTGWRCVFGKLLLSWDLIFRKDCLLFGNWYPFFRTWNRYVPDLMMPTFSIYLDINCLHLECLYLYVFNLTNIPRRLLNEMKIFSTIMTALHKLVKPMVIALL